MIFTMSSTTVSEPMMKSASEPMMKPLKEEFDEITVGNPTTFRNLTIFPIFRPGPACPEPDYLLAEDAIGKGVVKITELTVGGSVPEFRFENNSIKAVLLLDGEELIGGKQNRVLN